MAGTRYGRDDQLDPRGGRHAFAGGAGGGLGNGGGELARGSEQYNGWPGGYMGNFGAEPGYGGGYGNYGWGGGYGRSFELEPPREGSGPPPYRESGYGRNYDPNANWGAERRPAGPPVRPNPAGGGLGWTGDDDDYRLGRASWPTYRGYGEDRSARGQFAGRGPRNYRRSDARIEEDVNDRLTAHPNLDATDVEVQVADGEVTLTGTVSNRHEKRLAEDIAQEVTGVEDVHNRLRLAAAS